MSRQLRSGETRKADMRAQAAAMGVDEAFISELVDKFYARVRDNSLLGSVFENAIDDHWDEHLATLKDFWGSMALGTARYQGRPLPKHMALPGLTPEHFEVWLELFYKTLQDIAPTEAAEDWFITRAARIAKSFQLNLFPYQPGEMDGVRGGKGE